MKRSENFMRPLRNSEQGPILGLSLGFACVAEHEKGRVAYLEDQVNPQGLRLYEFPGTMYLVYLPGHFIPDALESNPAELDEKELQRMTGSWEKNFSSGVMNAPGITCAWGHYNFSIGVRRDNIEVVEFLRELYKAFYRGEGRVYLQTLPSRTPHWALCVYIEFTEATTIEDRPVLTSR